MTTTEESDIISVYCKIPFTEITITFYSHDSLNIKQFLQEGITFIRTRLNINTKYDIELVDVSQPFGEYALPLQPRNDQTLRERYRNVNPIVFYARPIDPNTREFIRRDEYTS